MRRAVAILALALAGGYLGCGGTQGEAVLVFDGGLGGLAARTTAVGVQPQSFVLDRSDSALVAVDRGGLTGVTHPVAAPPGGWPPEPVVAARTAVSTVSFFVPDGSLRVYHSTIDVSSATQTPWNRRLGVRRIVAFDGAVTTVTGDHTARVPSGNWPLPADAAALPAELGARGFPYRTTGGALAWWDPVSGAVTWQQDLGIQGGPIAHHPSGRVAWTDGARVLTAPVDAAGLGSPRQAPMDAAVLRMAYDVTLPSRLWVATAAGSLHRLDPGPPSDALCYVDRDGSGGQAGTIVFDDRGRLSNPRLSLPRVGRQRCSGWVLNDDWRVIYEAVPGAWTALTVGPGTTAATDLPLGDWVAAGDEFTTESGAVHRVTSVTPLAFDPPLAATATGQLVPRGRWRITTARRGFVGLVATGERLDLLSVAVEIAAGADPPDADDRFLFSLADGLTSFSAGAVFSNWERVQGNRVVATDNRTGAVHLFAPARGSEQGVIR